MQWYIEIISQIECFKSSISVKVDLHISASLQLQIIKWVANTCIVIEYVELRGTYSIVNF